MYSSIYYTDSTVDFTTINSLIEEKISSSVGENSAEQKIDLSSNSDHSSGQKIILSSSDDHSSKQKHSDQIKTSSSFGDQTSKKEQHSSQTVIVDSNGNRWMYPEEVLRVSEKEKTHNSLIKEGESNSNSFSSYQHAKDHKILTKPKRIEYFVKDNNDLSKSNKSIKADDYDDYYKLIKIDGKNTNEADSKNEHHLFKRSTKINKSIERKSNQYLNRHDENDLFQQPKINPQSNEQSDEEYEESSICLIYLKDVSNPYECEVIKEDRDGLVISSIIDC